LNIQGEENGFQKYKVLARGGDACKKLAGVKDVQFKYWKTEIPYLLIDAVFELYSGEMNAAFRKIRFILAEYFGGNNPETRKEYIQKIEKDVSMNAKIFQFLRQIPSFGLSFSEWSSAMTDLLQSFWGLEERPTFESFKRKKGFVMKEMANMPVERFHSSTDNVSNYYRSVDTIHALKGATLDAVLLFLSKDSKGQNISLNDFLCKGDAPMTEKQRLIYVACSRASQFLALAVPSEVSDDVVGRVFEGVFFDKRIINLQSKLAFDGVIVEN